MVSTRGLRYKFSEGERVLCYEPDPTKAKVLYDSKVLEVIESKDKRGRRTVEYLIHFQGWNSSWDRCVSEDFVLKDTEENRQLQRDLAEKSQLQLGAYLYRRERKKGSTASAGGGPAKRGRPGFSDDGSSSSTQPEEGEPGDTDSSSGSGAGSQPRSPPPPQCGRAHIALPSALRDRLTFDYHLVVKRGRLSRLPASPTAAQILESFVKWFARAGAWNPPATHAHTHAHAQHRPDMLDVSCRLNLVREVADGLRVYFDFILRGHLLYKQEHAQYHEVCGIYFNEFESSTDVKSEPDDEGSQSQDDAAESLEEDVRSPRVPEYSHLPPDPVRDADEEHPETSQETAEENTINDELNEKCETKNNVEKIELRSESRNEAKVKTRSETKDELKNEAKETRCGAKSEVNNEVKNDASSEIKNEELNVVKDEINSESPNDMSEVNTEFEIEVKVEVKTERSESPEDCPQNNEVEKAKEAFATTSVIVARRLRSHKSAVSQSEGEDAAGAQSSRSRSRSSAGSSGGSSLSEGWPRAPAAPAAPATEAPGRTPLSLLLEKVSRWQIIPREESTEVLPCRIYGAIHLARLFVKLPDFLNAAQMPDLKLKLILKHIDMFVQYLDEHSEWFGEMYYIADSVSRSH